MRSYIIEYLIALVIFLAIDFVWLAFVAKSFYVGEIGPLLRDKPNLAIAFVFYLLFVAGLVYFVIHPAQGVVHAALAGAFFGLVAYATYDLTNIATLKGFTTRVVVVDLMWGASVSAVVSAATVWISQRFVSG